MKLGKASPRHDPRTLRMARYMAGAPLAVPASCDWRHGIVEWGMMRNDVLGDCAIAAAGHLIEAWCVNATDGMFPIPKDEDIVAAYSAITGYQPGNPDSDRGAVELDVLNYWRREGIVGHKIGAYAAINHIDGMKAREAIYLFGGLYIGVALPLSAQGKDVWDVPHGWWAGDGMPGSWGGHAVPVVAYDDKGVTVISWGKEIKMTWAFWCAYVDEAYAVLSPDFFRADGKTPVAGLDLSALQADLAAVTGG